jgi:hypothetical protein
MSSNSVSLSHRNLLHHIEVTSERNNNDVNGLVFSYTSNGIFIKDFVNSHSVTIPWDS